MKTVLFKRKSVQRESTGTNIMSGNIGMETSPFDPITRTTVRGDSTTLPYTSSLHSTILAETRHYGRGNRAMTSQGPATTIMTTQGCSSSRSGKPTPEQGAIIGLSIISGLLIFGMLLAMLLFYHYKRKKNKSAFPFVHPRSFQPERTQQGNSLRGPDVRNNVGNRSSMKYQPDEPAGLAGADRSTRGDVHSAQAARINRLGHMQGTERLPDQMHGNYQPGVGNNQMPPVIPQSYHQYDGVYPDQTSMQMPIHMSEAARHPTRGDYSEDELSERGARRTFRPMSGPPPQMSRHSSRFSGSADLQGMQPVL